MREAPLVGRAAELALLLRRMDDARAGSGSMLLVVGEAGIGKSRLLPGYEQPATGARPGERAPHVWVEHGGDRISLLDLYDGQLTVVTGRGGTAWWLAAAGLAQGGLPLRAVELGVDVRDREGLAAARYRVTATSAVLVRPDGHVAARLRCAAGQTAAVLARAVDRALGRASEAVAAVAG